MQTESIILCEKDSISEVFGRLIIWFRIIGRRFATLSLSISLIFFKVANMLKSLCVEAEMKVWEHIARVFLPHLEIGNSMFIYIPSQKTTGYSPWFNSQKMLRRTPPKCGEADIPIVALVKPSTRSNLAKEGIMGTTALALAIHATTGHSSLLREAISFLVKLSSQFKEKRTSKQCVSGIYGFFSRELFCLSSDCLCIA